MPSVPAPTHTPTHSSTHPPTHPPTSLTHSLLPAARSCHVSSGNTGTGVAPISKKARNSSVSEARAGPGSAALSARLEKELERTLREFVRMRTVSSDPSLREDCFKGAKYLAHLLESLGEPGSMT